MYAVALRPGSWPPSPGFEPWAILISSWSARARYVAVTPNRADATCLIRASRRSPSGPGRVPGRVLAALAGVRGAAGPLDADRQGLVRLGASAPTLIAETTNRRTIDARVLDSASGDRRRDAGGPAARRAGRRGRPPAARAPRGSARARRRCRRRGDVSSRLRAVGGQDLDLAGDARREEVRLAVAAEAGEPGIGQARLAAGRRLAGWRARPRGAGAGARRGRRASSGRATRRPSGSSARRPRRRGRSTSMSAPPMYEATALMPIRARVLRRPASNAVDEAADGLGGRQRLGAARAGQLGGELDREPRMDRGRADGEDHRHGVDVENVDGADARSVRPRRPAAVRAVWTAPVARIDGTGSRSTDHAASVDEQDLGSGLGRPRPASAASRSRAASSPAGPSPESQVASSVRTGDAGRRRARRRARRGRRRSAVAGAPCAGRAAARRAAPAAGRARPAGP